MMLFWKSKRKWYCFSVLNCCALSNAYIITVAVKILLLSGDFGIEGYAYGDNISTLHANGNDNANGDNNEKG